MEYGYNINTDLCIVYNRLHNTYYYIHTKVYKLFWKTAYIKYNPLLYIEWNSKKVNFYNMHIGPSIFFEKS